MNEQEFTFASLEELKDLKANAYDDRNWYSYSHYNRKPPYPIEAESTPWGDPAVLATKLGLPSKMSVKCYHISQNPMSYYYNQHYYSKPTTKTSNHHKLAGCPIFILVGGDNQYYEENTTKFKITPNLQEIAKTAQAPSLIGTSDGNYYYNTMGSANMAISVEMDGHRVWLVMPFSVAERGFGLSVSEDMEFVLSNGQRQEYADWKKALNGLQHAYRNGSWKESQKLHKFDYTFDTLGPVVTRIGMHDGNIDAFIRAVTKKGFEHDDKIGMSGIVKTWKKIEPMMQDLLKADPMAYTAVRSLAAYSSKSVDGVKVSVVFNEIFEKTNTVDEISKAVKNLYCQNDKTDLYSARRRTEECVKKLSTYKEKRKAVLKSQANRALNKIMQDAESLTIDKKKHKLTWAEIEAGNLPLGTFFRKSEQYFILNDNWDLWEEMFKRGYREQAIELANEVKGRTTYEKDLMSYFYFVLYGLPDFLKKHTGKKWNCIPKLVNSQDELEPPKEEGGVARKRSALTPVADNDKNEVVVPYASLAIYGGFGTTYCYSHDYHVLNKGMSFHGYAVTEELEKKLNGRDDYGLMFYTLTGSAQGRGYPTFLIIFERRQSKGDTRVHFHRTHPCRSKDGDYNPIHNWIRVCYNWMAGNVNKDRIKAQQGDLAFVQIKTDGSGEDLDGAAVKGLKFNHKVNQYDSHCFEEPVPFAEYTKAAKSNVLGYVQLDKDTWLRHNEHDDVLIPAGTYAIHQCRSWEANPKGVWSLRID